MPSIDIAFATRDRRLPAALMVLWIALMAPGCGSDRDERLWQRAARYDVGDVSVALITSPDSPREGENELLIGLQASDGSPLRGASTVVVASMPAMGAMPYMESRASARETGPGVYRARYALSMQGDWDLQLIASRPGSHDVRGHWHLQTGVPGLRYIPEDVAGGSARPSNTAASDPLTGPGPGARTPAGDAHQDEGAWIDPATWRRVGVEVVTVTPHMLTRSTSILGQVAFDETRTAEVSMRLNGRIRRMEPVQVGTLVRAGQVLCTVYSPEMIAAEQEFLNAINSARSRGLDPSIEGHKIMELISAARGRLAGWDMPAQTIDSIQQSNQILQEFGITAPIAGLITQKSVVQGSYFAPGEVLFRISPTDPVRVILNLPESEREFARLGAPVEIQDVAGSGPVRAGRVVAAGAAFDERTRTLPVSISCRNPNGDLRAGAFARARFARALGEGIEVPESAVLRSNGGCQVCVETSRGRFQLRDVEPGAIGGGSVEIRHGLSAGERVATSGAYLIAAQLRLSQASRH